MCQEMAENTCDCAMTLNDVQGLELHQQARGATTKLCAFIPKLIPGLFLVNQMTMADQLFYFMIV